MNDAQFDVDLDNELINAGAPTFKQFCDNREKYLGKEDEVLGYMDQPTSMLKKYENKKRLYEIEGYRCKSLEEVERVARSQGIPLRDLDYRPEIIPQAGHKCDILIKFIPKWVREKRADW